ncbi:MAG: Transcription-repair-coupling factor [bacterium]|nr:transcription-repair coupling factor [bacterium]MBV6481932.1 Transcription-repair-coupling factor [bacterium]
METIPIPSLLDELAWVSLPDIPRCRVGGAIGSSPLALIAESARHSSHPILVIVADQPAMEETIEGLRFFGAQNPEDFWEARKKGSSPDERDLPPVFGFPHHETLPYENKDPELNLKSDRLRFFQILSDLSQPTPSLLPDRRAVLVVPLRSLMARMADLGRIRHSDRVLREGAELDRDALVRFLVDEGYESCELITSCGEFSVRGGIIDIFPYTSSEPIRIELFGDEIESIRTFDILTQRSRQVLQSVVLGVGDEFRQMISTWRKSSRLHGLAEYLPPETRIFWNFPAALEEEGHRIFSLVEKMFYQRSFLEEQGEAPEENPLLEIAPESYCLTYENLLTELDPFPWIEISSELPFHPLNPPEEVNLPVSSPNLMGIDFKMKVQEIVRRHREGEHFILVCEGEGQRERLGELILDAIEQGGGALDAGEMRRAALQAEHARRYTHEIGFGKKRRSKEFDVPGLWLWLGNMRHGFHCEQANLTLVSEQEIFGRFRKIQTRKKFSMGLPIVDLVDLQPGQPVVHIDHGIARFVGLKRLTVGGREGEFLELRFADEDVLYVPIEQIDRISRYISGDNATPKLSKLGSKVWQAAKARARKAIEDLTGELLKLYASREAVDGYSFPPDTPWQHAFEAAFPFEETPDQWKAIQDVKQDMESPRCMDRLICGDVGFGKTEVAMRAAFKAVCEGKQVAILAPTTVLVQQHHQTFMERMIDYPVSIDSASRFRTDRELKECLKKAGEGDLDILIGTHRLLQKDAHFKDLGLVIIDEEQRFGVKHKERLKQLRTQVDVLTLSATPIPRTLYMSMSGVRDMSLVNTPPSNRLPVETFILEFKPEVIENAILRELARGGQVFFLHNRVDSIYAMADMIQEIVPEARLAVGHGQMDGHSLEKIMQRFIGGEVDVLVSTTIIESGLDIPNANTILINRADTFGLSELYQLRGRVGRAKHQAYCYLLVPSKKGLTGIARERLLTLQENTALGSGFTIAMRDLEIRGMGNILGREQHGHIAAVGFDLYSSMLARAVEEMRGKRREDDFSVTLDSCRSGEFPPDYVPSARQRMSLHKRIAALKDDDARRRLREEIEDLYGKLPPEAEMVFTNLEMKEAARRAGIDHIRLRKEGARLRYSETAASRFSPAMVLELEKAYPKKIRVAVQNRLYLEIQPPKDENHWEDILTDILAAIEKAAKQKGAA